jgi:NTP pyrophosphatase (non-canonical NTP hydrolase)
MDERTLKSYQKEVDDWIKMHGVRYFNELTNMTILMEEVGELARLMSRKYGEQSFKAGENIENEGDEMADILWVLICLANQTGVDLTTALNRSIEKKTIRDRQRHHSNDKLK